MHYESVRAHPFGPFEDETLELAPGLNVVHGPNEAGKSTWHAALYAGLCGMRKAKGSPRAKDRLFRQRHQPWDGGRWAVSAVVALEDGRRIELRHDLANKASSAVDADLADRNHTGEILFDGAPDGSRWLGLNRRSFLGAACVRQAQILRLTDNPGVLKEDMQRAAATAGADETAARALKLLDDYRSERVGSARAPKRPLALARDRRDQCRSALDLAQQAQSEHLARQRHVERLEQEARTHEREAATLRAAQAADAAEKAARRAARAAELPAGWGDAEPDAAGPAPPHPAAGYLAAAGLAAGVGLTLADLAVPGLVAGAVGLGLLAWWWLAKRRAADTVPAAPPAAAAAEGQRLLTELRAEADRLRAQAATLAEGVVPADLAAARGASPNCLADAERAASGARAACHTARGELQQLAADRRSVADAEDALDAAAGELERVERLDRTLEMTIAFLKHAEERVHRTVAPVLRATVLKWLSQVTGDRYVDCKVDPESLKVEVRSRHGAWRQAALLSHGAAEQIYLLLRLALARHLVQDPEVCPLILDDVVAACDAERRRAVLETLHAVSAETQVVLFTHEEEVRAWGQRLAGPRDRLIELSRLDVG